jgi:manganese/iron transport system permease protein
MGILDYHFMQQTLLAGLLGGVACSVVGVLVVSMELSFIGVSISHAAFAGSIIAFFFGFDPLWGALAFGLAAAAAVGPLSDRVEFSPDTTLGVIFAMMHGLAFLFMGMISTAKTAVLDLMWGNALAVSGTELIIIAVTCLIVVGTVSLFYKEVQAVIFNREIALAVGLPAGWIFYLLLFLTGLTVAANLQPIGGLLVCTLIITPAAAAYQLTYALKHLFLLSIAFGVFSCVSGLILSYYIDVPSGAVIVLISGLIFLLANTFSPKRRVKRIPAKTPAGSTTGHADHYLRN